MWVKVDDKFPEHAKVVAAGDHLGRYGCGRVVAIWTVASCWTNRNETDGVIPLTVFREMFRLYDRAPLQVAAAMAESVVIAGETRSGLFEALADGYRLHDHGDYQPTRAKQEAKREETRLRVQDWRARQVAERAALDNNASCNSVTNGGVTPGVTLLVTPPPDPDPDPIPNPKSADARARGPRYAYDGRVLKLTHRQHEVLVRMCNAADVDLLGEVYPRWNRDLEASGEPFDVLPWCTAQLAQELGIRRPGGPTAGDRREAEGARRRVGRCPHTPPCADYAACVDQFAVRCMLRRTKPLAVRT